MSWHEEFAALCQKTHREQGHWWLNGFWKEGAEGYKEDIWNIVHQFIECQRDAPLRYGRRMVEFDEGCDLDELKSHRLLEIMGETLTVIELRKRLRKLDIDNNNKMALSEYLLDKYKKTPQELVDAPQGDLDPAELAKAEAACQAAADALGQAADEAAASAKAKKAAEESLVFAKKAEAASEARKAELQASVDAIVEIEEGIKKKIAKCQAIIDGDGGAVKKGRATAEKEAILSEDPLPLRKAKITQKAAVRKAEKARQAAEAATAASAEAAAAAAQAKIDADAAEKEAEEALKRANAALTKLKKAGGSPLGKIWWMERVLEEKKKFMKN